MLKYKMKQKNETGFVYILFFFFLPVFLLLLGLVIDTANLYSASLKANAAAEAGVASALLSRVNEKDVRILGNLNPTPEVDQEGNVDPPLDDVSNRAENEYLEKRVEDSATNSLVSNGVMPIRSSTRDKDRSLQIVSVTGTVENGDILKAEIELRVPTLFLHFMRSHQELSLRSKSIVVKGLARSRIRGGNFIFLVDLSSSQACPAGSINGQPYCLCNTINRKVKDDGTVETCQEEANRVVGDNNGKIRAELTRDALIKSISRLDRKRDRVSVIGFNTVAFTIIPFRLPDPSNSNKARKGFNNKYIEDRLKQIKSLANAKISGMEGGRVKIVGNNNGRVPTIVPEGSTNLSDGYLTALQEARAARLTTEWAERFDVVYYSDGAPTAMRGSIDGLEQTSYNVSNNRDRVPRTFHNALSSFNRDPQSYPRLPSWNNDFISYQVVIDDGAGNIVNSFGPLVDTALYKRWYLFNLMTVTKLEQFGKNVVYQPYYLPDLTDSSKLDSRKGFNPNILPPCHCGKSTNTSCNREDYAPNSQDWRENKDYIYNKDIFNTNQATRETAISRCFSSVNSQGRLGFNYPNNNNDTEGSTFGREIEVNKMFQAPNDFRNLYYIAALEAAELLRKNGGRISGIGYGAEAANKTGPTQGLNDVAGLKAGVMANLSSAYDELKSMYPRKDDDGKDFDEVPEFGDALYPSYQTLEDRKKNGVAAGGFENSPTPEEFEVYLDKLIMQLRASLIEVN